MLLRRIKTPGIAHNSYYLASDGNAVIVDPRRDIDVYIELARERGDTIRYVLETHRNEDYVIGSSALEQVTGAQVLHGSGLDFHYGTTIADGDEIGAGRLTVRALATPGHTPESLSYAVIDRDTHADSPLMVFSGDTLFVGATGRTDLYGEDEAERMALALHDSLFRVILSLGDHVLLYPAHGSGSVCASGVLERDPSTLGIERKFNPDLVDDSEAFIARKLAEKHVRPPYFRRMETLNLCGDAPVYQCIPLLEALSPGEVADAMSSAFVIDTRMPQAFAGGHIPGSYNLWQDGLAAYLGWIAPPDARILFVLPEKAEQADVVRTALRLGYDNLGGYLRGGFEAWQNQGREVERIRTIDTQDLMDKRSRHGDDLVIVDVRKPDESSAGTIPGALRIFVGELADKLEQIPRGPEIVTMCSVGHRAGLAASILARHGYRRVYNYLGGYQAWTRSGGPTQLGT